MRLVKYHDGSKFVTAVEVDEDEGGRRLLWIGTRGPRSTRPKVVVRRVPLDHPVAGAGKVRVRDLDAFARCGRTFGISKPARAALREARAMVGGVTMRGAFERGRAKYRGALARLAK